MKIPLRMGAGGPTSQKATQAKTVERDILGVKRGDWEAKNNLVRTFMPLLTQLAQKRSQSVGDANALIDMGKEGLFHAARKYSPSMGVDRFQVMALEMIEERMDGKGGGFFARLFGW